MVEKNDANHEILCKICTFALENNKYLNSLKESDDYVNNSIKEFKYSNDECMFCLSLFSERIMTETFAEVKEKSSEIENFRLTTGFTPLFTLAHNYLKHQFDTTKVSNKLKEESLVDNSFIESNLIRKIFKPLLVKHIKDNVKENKKYVLQNSNNEINVTFDFSEKVYSILYECFSGIPAIKRLGEINFKFMNQGGKGLDRGHINEIIKTLNTDYFKALVEKYDLLTMMNSTIKVNVNLIIDSIYLKGSYIKYSREIGQSPWTINGQRVCSSSVQDELRNPLMDFFKAENVIMHAGGREDRDVRMLGSGRPCMLEVVNPKNFEIVKYLGDSKFMESIQDKINSSSILIQIKDLNTCERGYIDVIKKFEDSKIKNYTAIVWCEKEITDKDIEILNDIKNLEITQKTPIRVAHRRTLLDRKKTILNLKANQINEHFIKLDVMASAGTYIKEFVHSDLGRTTPSVVSLLGCDCDILQLDVTNIILEK